MCEVKKNTLIRRLLGVLTAEIVKTGMVDTELQTVETRKGSGNE